MSETADCYEILGVTRHASAREIEEAYDRLAELYESGPHGLDPARAAQRLNLVNQAYWTLLDPDRRARYDAALAGNGQIPVQFEMQYRDSPWKAPRGVLNIIGRIIVMGLLVQVGYSVVMMVFSTGNMEQSASEIRKRNAENPAFQAERAAEAERIARIKATQAVEEYERRQRGEARHQEYTLESDRRYADEVTEDLRRAEEKARQEAEAEQRRQAEAEAQKAEEERERIRRLHEQWQSGRNSYTGSAYEQ